MTAPALTPTQREILAALATGLCARFESGRTYSINDTYYPNAVYTLIEYGYISNTMYGLITPAGRAALDAEPKP